MRRERAKFNPTSLLVCVPPIPSIDIPRTATKLPVPSLSPFDPLLPSIPPSPRSTQRKRSGFPSPECMLMRFPRCSFLSSIGRSGHKVSKLLSQLVFSFLLGLPRTDPPPRKTTRNPVAHFYWSTHSRSSPNRLSFPPWESTSFPIRLPLPHSSG